MIHSRQRGALSLRGRTWSVRLRMRRDTPVGLKITVHRVSVGPISKYRTRAAARLAADRILSQHGIALNGRTVAFDAFADIFLKDHLLALQLTTRAAYGSVLRSHLVPHFRSTPLHELPPGSAADLVSGMIKAGRSRATIKKTVCVLGRVLELAAELGYAVTPLNRRTFRLPPAKPPKERRRITPVEAARIIEASDWPWPSVALAEEACASL